MPFDDYGMSGEGTLEEYFTHKPNEQITDPDWTPEFAKQMQEMQAETDERDGAVDRLCLQLFSEFSGLDKTEIVQVSFPEPEYTSMRKAKKALQEAYKGAESGGLVLLGWQPDDPILALYKDGQPIAAFYASYRGAYIAGGYVHQTGQEYLASNFHGDETDDTWLPGDNTCADIARDFLLKRR